MRQLFIIVFTFLNIYSVSAQLPTISISKDKGDTICAKTKVNFSSSITNGGANPKYYWYKNGVLKDTNTTYVDSNITLTDSIICLVKKNSTDSAWSNAIKLVVLPSTTYGFFDTTCWPNPYFFNGVNRFFGGTYRDTLTNMYGCDSFVILYLTLGFQSVRNLNIVRCSNNPYFFKGQFLSTSGIYRDTLVNMAGCDSFVTLNLTIRQVTYNTLNIDRCIGQNYFFNGGPKIASGVYYDTLVNTRGCDSFVTLNLTFHPIETTLIDTGVCSNVNFVFNGNTLTMDGTYRDTFQSIWGCDSFIVLNFRIKKSTGDTIYHAQCRSIPAIFNNQTLTSSGIYFDTFVNSEGCDSILSLFLTIFDTNVVTIDTSICYNQSFYFNGTYVSDSGTYRRYVQ